MGRQIQIRLSEAAEEALSEHLHRQFPYCRIVDQDYPTDWDRRTLHRSADAQHWVIIDSRTDEVLIESAIRYENGSFGLRSRAFSCIEWTRVFSDRPNGRLYLNTDPDPIWMDVSALSGHSVEKMFQSAQSWIRRRCKKVTDSRYPIWADS